MIQSIKTYVHLILPIFLVISANDVDVIYKTNQYSVSINHPGENEPVKITLYQVLDKEGVPVQYYMDVPSVICLEEVCKIIPVRLYWDNLGEYQKYELEKGATLEKYKADLFEPEDYIKLQHILSDNNSPFKEVYYDEILTAPTSEEDVDAVSGETIIELDEKDTVHGAALGCYTLWHWANGEIVEKIKNLTGKVLNDNFLKRALKEKNRAYYFIGIKELENRKDFSSSFVNIIIDEVLKEDKLLKATFKYLEKSPSEVYFNAAKKIFLKGRKAHKLTVIRSLKYSTDNPKKEYLDNLSDEISSLHSFQEVSFFLDLMTAKNPNSKIVTANVFSILDAKIIIARKAYWFLKKQSLTPAQKEKLTVFYQSHKNNL